MTPTIALPAATILLVRDQPAFEVLMVRRHSGMAFGPGASVFPGGKLDLGDQDPVWTERFDAAESVDEDRRALSVCAVRETFEETGLLLGVGGINQAEADRLRTAVTHGQISFLEAFIRLGGRLRTGSLVPFARWITPDSSAIRFDAAFFIAHAPIGQVAVCDGAETVDAEWLEPETALSLGVAGQRRLMYPTSMCLQTLAQSANAEDAIAAARARVTDPEVGPGVAAAF